MLSVATKRLANIAVFSAAPLRLVTSLLHLRSIMLHNGVKIRMTNSMKPARLLLHPDFPDLVARAGVSQRAFARQAGVSFSTIMGLVHPNIHPGRRGGMQRRTAWRLAKAYGELVNIDADAAFRLLIVEQVSDASASLHGGASNLSGEQ